MNLSRNCLLAGLAAMVGVATVGTAPAALVSYWNFDEADTGTVDAYDLAGNNDGTFGGTAVRTTGLIGMGAALYDGTTGTVNVTNGGGDFAVSAGVTIEALIQPADQLGVNQYEEVFRKEDGNNRLLFSFQEWGGILSFGANLGGYSELDMPLDGLQGRPTLAELKDGNLHHVVATYDSATGDRAIWVDGTQHFSDNRGAGTPIVTTNPGADAHIGSSGGLLEPFSGVIDEVAFYDAALSSEEIGEHFSNVQAGDNYFGTPFDVWGVRVGASSLISTLDYSDTFTLTAQGGIPGRVVNVRPVGLPGINVEGDYGNPPQVWTDDRWAISDDDNATSGGTTFPGSSGAGSEGGMTQTDGAAGSWGIEYGVRGNFVVQTDFVQTADGVGITVGGVRDDVDDPSNVSVLFRKAGHASPEIGLYHSATGEVQTGLTSGIGADQRWHNYAVRVDTDARVLEVFVDQRSRGSIDLDTVAGGALAGLTLSNDAVTVGYAGGDRGWSDNFQVGASLVHGVAVGSSRLIDTLDYSDSFRLTIKGGNPGRTANAFPVGEPGIQVENSHGNAPQAWSDSKWSVSSDPNAVPGGTSYPGGSGSGSASGMSQTGGGAADWGIEYGLRDDFVVQTDFVQTAERVDVTVGAVRDTIGDAGNLSFFFRASGGAGPEIGLYNPTVGEVDTGLRSGIASAGRWHNYAVRVNVPNRMLEVFVDQRWRGAVELDTLADGAFADVPLSGAAVSVGYGGGDRGWSDNFQVGSGMVRGVAVGNSGLIDTLDYSDTWTLYDRGGLEDRATGSDPFAPLFPLSTIDYPENGVLGEGLAVENNHGNPPQTWSNEMWSLQTDANPWSAGLSYPGGSGAGTATGFTQRGGGGDWGIEYGLRNRLVVQTDFVQTSDRIHITVGGVRDNISDPSNLSVFFRTTDHALPEISLYNSTVGEQDTGLTSGIAPDGEWHNYAVEFNLNERELLVYVDQALRGTVDINTVGDGALADLKISNAAVSVGYAGGDRGWSDNFQVGSSPSGEAPPLGVAVGNSELIGTLDYFDSFRLTEKAGMPGRVANAYPVGLPGVNVEGNRGNPPQVWTDTLWSLSDDARAIPGQTSYPGGSGTGSATGMVQKEGGSEDWGIEYGLRNDFVVQADFVQSAERIGITAGGSRNNIADPTNLSVFFRRTGHASPEIALYNPTVGEHDTGLTSGIASDGQWHNYAVRVHVDDRVLQVFVDQEFRGAVDLDSVAGGTFAGVPLLGAAVSTGYAGGDRGWSDNFQVGAGLARGVRVGSSSLIDAVDYSDSFTLTAKGGIEGRVANVEPVGLPGINVENNHANPPRVWTDAKWAVSSDPNVLPTTASPYPGGNGAGSTTGITQTSAGSGSWGIEYGLRRDFVVQTDFVQTADRVGITVGGARDDVDDPSNLSVFFRKSGHASSEITLYNATLGEHDTGLTSGIPSDGEWHNYAVRVNGLDRVLNVFVDEVPRGLIDLDTIAGGAFSGLELSNAALGVGFAGGDRGWSDNFQIGSGFVQGVRVGRSNLIGTPDYSDSFTLTYKGGIDGREPNAFPVGLPGVNVENNDANPPRQWTDAMWSISSDAAAIPGVTPYPGGSDAGSASGMTQRGGGGGDWGIEYGLRNDFVVQTDFLQTTDRIDVCIGQVRDTIFDPGSLSVFFRTTDHPFYPEIGLYNVDLGEHDTGLLSGIPAAGEWHNYAVRFNLDERELSVYIDELLRGMIDLDTVAGGAFAGFTASNAAVTVGYAGGDRGWSDNFMVGLPGAPILTSVQTGYWNDPTTWNDGELIPTEDNRTVVGPHTVTVAANGAAKSLLIDHPIGVVVVNADYTLDVVTGVEVPAGTLDVRGVLNADSAEFAAGTLIVGNGARLNLGVGGGLLNSVVAGEGATIQGNVFVSGTVSWSDPAGALTVDGGFELGDTAAYAWQLDGPADNLLSTTADAYLAGTLTLQALGKLRDPSGDPLVEWYGDETRTILNTQGEGAIFFTFENVPQSVPEVPILVGEDANWGQGHLGYGVFLTRLGDGGANTEFPPDPPHYGISYTARAAQAHLFQACDGDTNGDRNLNSFDIQNILSRNKYLTGEPANWIEGNFNAHDPEGVGREVCDSKDIQLLLATALWNTPQPYSEPPEIKLADGEGVAELMLTPREDGLWNLQIDTHGLPLNSYVIHSAEGILTGEDAANLGMFRQDDEFTIGGAGFGVLVQGVHDLGAVIGPVWDGPEGLSFTYTVEGASGLYEGRVVMVPEPGTVAMLLAGGLGLLLSIRRRKRAAWGRALRKTR